MAESEVMVPMAPPWIMAFTDPIVCGSSQLSTGKKFLMTEMSKKNKNSTLCTDSQLLGILAAARHLILRLMDVPNLRGFQRP